MNYSSTMRQALALFLALCLTVPNPVFALRPHNGGLEEQTPTTQAIAVALDHASPILSTAGLEETAEQLLPLLKPVNRPVVKAWLEAAQRINHRDRPIWDNNGRTKGLPGPTEIASILKKSKERARQLLNRARERYVVLIEERFSTDLWGWRFLPTNPESGKDPGGVEFLRVWIEFYNRLRPEQRISSSAQQLFSTYRSTVDLLSPLGQGTVFPLGDLVNREGVPVEDVQSRISDLNRLFSFVGGIPAIPIVFSGLYSSSQVSAGLEQVSIADFVGNGKYAARVPESQRALAQMLLENGAVPIAAGVVMDTFQLVTDSDLAAVANTNLKKSPIEGVQFTISGELRTEQNFQGQGLIIPSSSQGPFARSGISMRILDPVSEQQMNALTPLSWIALDLDRNLTVDQVLNLHLFLLTSRDEQGRTIHAIFA